MKRNTGYAFIPSFVFSNFLLAIAAPYLIILLTDIGYTPFLIGLLLSIYEGAGIAGPFVLGRLSDRTGNYRVSLLLSCILPAMAVFPLITMVHPIVSAIFLFLLGFGFRSLMSLIDAITTVQIGEDGNYGRIRVWGSIAFIVMTLFTQWTPFLKPESASSISLWLFMMSILCMVPIFILKKPMLKVPDTHHDSEEVTKPAAVSKGYIFCGFSIIFLSRFGLASVLIFLSLYMKDIAKWDAVGLIWALAAVSEVPFIFLSKRLIKRFGSMSLMAVSALGVTMRLLIMAFLPLKPWIVISALLHSICFGIYQPATIQFVSSVYPAHKRGTGMSMLMIIGTGIPAITGALAGGAIIQAFGYKTLFLINSGIAALAVLIYLIGGRFKSLRVLGF